jgi:hypothetical protein
MNHSPQELLHLLQPLKACGEINLLIDNIKPNEAAQVRLPRHIHMVNS